ncbi:16S rRNA (adenine(1518)-N(6)/adenine(1519)-N(6))-dimethyltransferase, partial [Gammaproteobacteria bacterium]|nr:16S rRNA (adenine(1518)-N(6)/adenine(1519)-N(6))-dimethyltransferase [Gammaproteobacteria bacterium]
HIRDMHFMLQREVVDRMTAKPSTKAYGRLSVMTQLHCNTEKLFEVPPEAFSPRPKVQSAIIRLTPKKRATDVNSQLLESILVQAFSMRRKTIRNALRKFLTVDELESLHLNPQLRPENLTIEDYLSCTRFVGDRS